MKCIVTGGCGFIGSHLVDKLIKDGHEVTIIDDMSSGKHVNPDAKLIKADISIPLNYEFCKEFFNVDWVFHLAGKADIIPSISDPEKYYQTNVTGTFNMIDMLKGTKVKKFVYAASSSCYGLTKTYPTPENEECIPEYPYALTKYLGEQIVMHWGKVYKIPVVSLRLFNVYGRRSRTTGAYGAVIGTFLKQRIAGYPLTIVGHGEQSRDFVHVSDVVDAFILAAQSNVKNHIFNVGSGNPHNIKYLASLIDKNFTFIPERPGEPDKTHADILKITKKLGWKPKVKFEDGIQDLITHIDEWKNAPLWTEENIKCETEDWFKCLR